ncbi:MAG: hypothetical protein DWQ36_13370 [Acidobacteria bacterium]|nr:MAG: hypothetical protein DWQ30_05680 [Acidobacteriota bacterium]REK06898.1 MAG: hypothetical protein DWQ36_13370 [Acidobacteriota bacterium]
MKIHPRISVSERSVPMARRSRRPARSLALAFAFAALLGIGSVACEQDGPLEEAGEEIDDAIDDATDG